MKFRIIFAFFLAMAGSFAWADLEISPEKFDQVQRVAVVAYQFERDEISMYGPGAGPGSRRKPIELTIEDHEHIVMHAALNNVMDVFRQTNDFEFIGGRPVITNSKYIDLSSGTKKLTRRGWYFPLGYRNIRLSRDNSAALCAALDVDALMQLHFSYESADRDVPIDNFNVFEKRQTVILMRNDILMLSCNGDVILSGTVRSKPVATEDGMATIEKPVRSFYPSLLVSFLTALQNAMSESQPGV